MSKTIKVQSKPFFLKNNDMDRLSSDLIVYIYSFLPGASAVVAGHPMPSAPRANINL